MPVLTNIRHELFAQAVAKGADLVAAYEQAGFKRHESSASRLRSDAKVAERIDELLKDAAMTTGITLERVIQEIGYIAMFDLREAADWGVREVPLKKPVGRVRTQFVDYLDLKPAKELPECVARAIASVKRTKDGVEIKPYNKLDALLAIGRHLGLMKAEDAADKGSDALVAMIIKAHNKSRGDDAKVIEGERTDDRNHD